MAEPATKTAPPSLDELRHRRDEVLAICSAYGASNVRVFGSVARGEQDEQSDLDLLVDLARGTGLFKWSALIGALEELLGCSVDVVTENGLRERVKPRVLREAVPL